MGCTQSKGALDNVADATTNKATSEQPAASSHLTLADRGETESPSSCRSREIPLVSHYEESSRRRGYSSGASSDTDSDRFNLEEGRSRANTADRLGIGAIRETVQADGQLGSKVIRMETPFGKPIEEIYDGVRSGPVLGSGVSGVVRLVTHKATGVKYAVKCLDLGLIKSEEGLQQLREEIHIMCQLDHPNIVRLEEVYEGFSEIYLVMELCVGGDLFDRLDEQPDFHYTEAQCARLIKQMLSSVRYLHSKNIIHRDLKLENFLFSGTEPDSVLKMIDFGLSKHFSYGEIQHEAVGTPYTVAPEIIKGSYNEKGDIWAIGVITYLLLSGETPFGGVDGEDLLEVRKNILRGSLMFEPADIWQNVSAFAKDFVRMTLMPEPEQRPSAKEAQRHRWIQTYSKKPNEEGSSLNPNVVKALVGFKEFSDMRKLLCEVLSFTLLPEQINDLREEFEKFDNGEGEISLTDLKKVLLESAESRALGGMTEQEVEDVFNALRVRKQDPKIRWHEFIAAGLSQCAVDERNLKLAFDRLDTGRKGYITFDNVIDLVGESDACENKEEMKTMWLEGLQHINGNVEHITCDDFLIIMKGQALGQSQSQEFDLLATNLLDSFHDLGSDNNRVSRHSRHIEESESKLEPLKESGPPSGKGSTVRAARAKSLIILDDDPILLNFREKSRSFEHKKSGFFDLDDVSITIEEEKFRTLRPSVLVSAKSKKNIESVVEDETKTPLFVNKTLYRAHREMRISVLEASKRFEEKQRRFAAQPETRDGSVQPIASTGLVMRRGTNPEDIEQSHIDFASIRSGRPMRRNRRKTVSDMTGML